MSVAGNQRAVTDRGLLTVEELYRSGDTFLTFNNKKTAISGPVVKSENKVDIFRITCYNGLTHDITLDHQIAVRFYTGYKLKTIRELDLKVDEESKARLQQAKGLFGPNFVTSYNTDSRGIPNEIWGGDEATHSTYLYLIKDNKLFKEENAAEIRFMEMNLGTQTQVAGWITSIEVIDNDYVYDVPVKSKDNLWICNGFLTRK